MKHLQVGDKAPKFETIDQNGTPFSSQSLAGRKWIIYFYPKDLTPGCINQACNLRDNYTILHELGITVIGVSKDSEKLHQRFIRKYDLPFPLLADTTKEVIESFGVWGEKKFMGRKFDGIHRTTFLINEENTIIGIIDKPKTKNHTEEILALFKLEKLAT